MRFEIMRLDEANGTGLDDSSTDITIVDEASVRTIVQQAAAAGERLYIRPAE